MNGTMWNLLILMVYGIYLPQAFMAWSWRSFATCFVVFLKDYSNISKLMKSACFCAARGCCPDRGQKFENDCKGRGVESHRLKGARSSLGPSEIDRMHKLIDKTFPAVSANHWKMLHGIEALGGGNLGELPPNRRGSPPKTFNQNVLF